MSADNWAFCPKCKKVDAEENTKRVLNVATKYGKIPSDEYIQLVNEASQPIELKETLREDYEVYTDENGKFSVSYGCSCSVCGFEYNFEHTEKIKY